MSKLKFYLVKEKSLVGYIHQTAKSYFPEGWDMGKERLDF